MKILVTGGAGYIGSHTCLELLGLDMVAEVVIIDNFCNSSPEVLHRLKKLSGKDIPFYRADVRDSAALETIFKEHEIDLTIHFAGLKAVGESVSVPLSYYDNNLSSTIELCEAMGRFGVKKLIFSSSATVYSPENEMPLTEESKTGDCTNPYGWTKFMCEQILRDAAAANPDWSVALLRYFNPIGAHPSGQIGEDPGGIPNNLLPYITQTAIGRREYLPVNGVDYPTPDGTCIRDYIHVTDLAKGHAAAIEFCGANKGCHAFNLGTGRGTSVFEMIDAFESASGVNVPRKLTGRRAGDQPVSYTATDKAAGLLNWRAEKTVLEACADSWRWQSMNPKGFS